MEKAIPEASREILKKWQTLGVVFSISGREAIVAFEFGDVDATKYAIPKQLVPEGVTVGQVQAMWEQGLRLNFHGAEVKDTFNWYEGTEKGAELLSHLRIPTQPIPKKLLAVPVPVTEQEVLLPGLSALSRLLETDPNGRDPHAPGAKLDAGKNRLGLVLGGFARALEEVGKVGTYGANKYSPNGWKKVPDGIARYDDAMLRHWLSQKKDWVDAETGLLHQAQVVWNALAVLELMLADEEE